jgi:hypothetical protein
MIDSEQLQQLIAQALDDFYRRRIQRLADLKLRAILRRKNPYLYKAIGAFDPVDVIEEILKAYLSSSDEEIFGEAFFEPIAKAVSGGVVSPTEGVDIAIETDDRYTAIAMKSGPNPFNSSQVKRQSDEFETLRRRLIKLRKQFDPVLGHGYGRKQSPPTPKKLYRDSSGEKFWEELTGDPDFYLKLIRYMEQSVVEAHRPQYIAEYKQVRAIHLQEFLEDFCADGLVDWEKLVRFNSGKDSIRLPRRKKQKRAVTAQEDSQFTEGG